MPLYEYRCLKCGALLEKIQKFSDPPLTQCEKCGARLERLLSPPAIQFKGSGWYVTDYARKSAGDRSKPESASSEKSDGSSGGTRKADQTPAANKSHESAPKSKK